MLRLPCIFHCFHCFALNFPLFLPFVWDVEIAVGNKTSESWIALSLMPSSSKVKTANISVWGKGRRIIGRFHFVLKTVFWRRPKTFFSTIKSCYVLKKVLTIISSWLCPWSTKSIVNRADFNKHCICRDSECRQLVYFFILINFLSYHFIRVRVAFLWLIKVEKGVGGSYQERMQTTFCTKLLVTIKSFCSSNEIRHFSKSAILCFANNLKKCSTPII